METKIYKIELQVSELIIEELFKYGIIRHLALMGQNIFCTNYSDSLDAEKAIQIISTIKQSEDILKQIRSQQLETTSELCRDVLDDAG